LVIDMHSLRAKPAFRFFGRDKIEMIAFWGVYIGLPIYPVSTRSLHWLCIIASAMRHLLLQRGRIACNAERCFSLGNSVRPSLRPSVRPSVRQ